MPADNYRSALNSTSLTIFRRELSGSSGHDVEDRGFEGRREVVFLREMASTRGENVVRNMSGQCAVLRARNHVIVDGSGDEDGLQVIGAWRRVKSVRYSQATYLNIDHQGRLTLMYRLKYCSPLSHSSSSGHLAA